MKMQVAKVNGYLLEVYDPAYSNGQPERAWISSPDHRVLSVGRGATLLEACEAAIDEWMARKLICTHEIRSASELRSSLARKLLAIQGAA